MASSVAAFAGGVVYLGLSHPVPAGRVVRIWVYSSVVPMWDAAAALLRMVFKNNPRVHLGWGWQNSLFAFFDDPMMLQFSTAMSSWLATSC